jgi:hypothetical protein
MFVKVENIDLKNQWIVFQNHQQQRRYFKMEQVDLIIEEYLEKTTDLPQVTDKLHHIMLTSP